MKIIDLTHILHSDMPVFPEAEPPCFAPCASIENDGYMESKIIMPSHTGTHMDAPAHVLPGGKTLDQYAVDSFAGSACALDLSEMEAEAVSLEIIQPYRRIIEGSDFVLLRSGWSRRWGDAAYYTGYPVLSLNAAKWISELDIKGIGLDMISVDPVDSVDLPVHKIFMRKNILIIENLTNLHKLPEYGFMFCAMPLKYRDSDGAPVRAVGMFRA